MKFLLKTLRNLNVEMKLLTKDTKKFKCGVALADIEEYIKAVMVFHPKLEDLTILKLLTGGEFVCGRSFKMT